MENLRYIRTDKNGTEIYHDYTCRRCGGAGASDKWYYTGKTCWDCGGTGVNPVRPQIVKKYTPEYEAKLQAKREARRAKQQAELRAKAEQINEQFLQEYFPDGKCYVLAVGDPWAVMDELKAAGVEYTNCLGYYFTEKQDKFPTIELTPLEATYTNSYGIKDFDHNLWKLIDAKIKALKPVSQYVGTVGEKITLTAKYDHCAWYETKSFKGWGTDTVYIHTFITPEGNLLVWKTGIGNIKVDEGDSVQITATVKEHSEYKGDKQTILTRCKIAQG